MAELNSKTSKWFMSKLQAIFGEVDFEESNKKLRDDFEQVWDVDFGKMGSIIRAHLVVEYYMTKFLISLSPELNRQGLENLSFFQKMSLMPFDHLGLIAVKPSLELLNSIRNRMVHNLNAKITEKEMSTFDTLPNFGMKVIERTSIENIQPLESFARRIAFNFHFATSMHGKRWMQASAALRDADENEISS